MRLALLVEQALAPVPGGTGRYAVEVARALASRPDVEVTAWTAYHRDISAARVAGTTGPRRLPLPRRALALAWERGIGPVPRGADVVHATTLLAPPRPRGCPLVVTIHDAVPWTHPETLTQRGVAWHRRAAARVAATADAIVVPTEAVRVALAEVLPLGDRVHVIGEGVSPSVVAPSTPVPAELAARLGLPSAGYLLTLATLEPRKGLDVLLEAMALPAAPDLPLLCVGQPGWGGVDPVATARRLGLPDGRVRVLGRVPDAELATLLSGATALVAPSRAEGFGLPALEAMAAGVPVVSSDAPALVEVARGASLLVPVGDPVALAAALRRIVDDADLRARLVTAGLAVSADQTWDLSARRLGALYRQLVGAKPA